MAFLSPDESQILVAALLDRVRSERLPALHLNFVSLSTLPDEIFDFVWLRQLSVVGHSPMNAALGQRLIERAKTEARATSSGLLFGEMPLHEYIENVVRSMQPPPARLSYLSERIGELTELEELNLSHQALTGLPDSLCELPRLRRLSLAYNPLMSLPERFAELQQLEMLDLRGHIIDRWPGGFYQMPFMRLDVTANAREARYRKNMAVKAGDYEAAADARRDELRWGLHA